MSLDGLLLNKVQQELQTMIPCKINKIQQISNTDILFTIRSNQKNHKLLISCHSVFNRIHETMKSYTTVVSPQSFMMVLRKHINGAIIKKMEQLGYDRVLKFTLEARNEMGDIHTPTLYIELMGKYANLILVDENNRVIDALKRIPPFENTVRTLHPGANFVPVKAHLGKKDPFAFQSFNMDESLTMQFHGFSPILSQEFFHRMRQGETFGEIMDLIKNSGHIYHYEQEQKTIYHVLPLTHLNIPYKVYPMAEAMDHIYDEKEEKTRIKEQTGDLFKLIKKELKKNQTKLSKLEKTLNDAYQLDDYIVFGDLLYAYANQYPHKQKEVVLPSFETGAMIHIPLNEKLDMKQNAKKYYQKYRKAKNAQTEVAKQIELTQDTIQYLENIEMQIEQASLFDAMEIREELSNRGYLRKKQRLVIRKKKSKPHFLTLLIDDTIIYVGKNNIQNDYITWKQARKEHLWLHAKDIHGAHVVINTASPNEKVLRIAAMFAAYYSKARFSSSVAVNYCLIKELKKVSKSAIGYVALGNYKTIYIDPEEEVINAYLSIKK